MQEFLFAHARGRDAADVVERCIARLGEVPPEANLGFVYVSDQAAVKLGPALEQLRERAPEVHWVGTVGVGLCVAAEEIYDEPALAVMVGAFPAESFRLLPNIREGLAEVPESLREWCASRGYCFGLLHGDPANVETPELIEQLAEQLPITFVNGGLTSSNLTNHQIADELISGGVSGVLFDEQVAVATDHTQGCSPVGGKHAITEAQRNVVATLDNRNALEVMKEDIGEVLARDLTRVGGYIFAGLPIQGSDTGDYMVRNLLAVDTHKGLIAVGDYLEGREELMFCRRDGNTAREDMLRMLGRLKGNVGGRRILGGVYVSCLGRGRHQFGEDSEELKMIRDNLGDFPLVGFFANGEIYNGRLYGYTGVLTLFLA